MLLRFRSVMLSHLILRVSLILALLGFSLSLIGTGLVGASVYLNFNTPNSVEVLAREPECPDEAGCRPLRYATRLARTEPTAAASVQPSASPEAQEQPQSDATMVAAKTSPAPTATTPLITPRTVLEERLEITSTQSAPAFKLLEDADPTTQPVEEATPGMSRTPTLTTTTEVSSSQVTATPTPTAPASPEPEIDVLEAKEVEPSATPAEPPPPAEIVQRAEIELPAPSSCPAGAAASFELIPIEGQPLRDHPADVHGDLNLALRGYIPSGEKLGLVSYEGNTDGDAPQLAGLFEPNRVPQIQSTYRINDWIWDSSQCGGHPRGCPGPPADTFWPVTLIGLAATPGEAIYPPERGSQIYSGGYTAIVLYAEERRITLGYTRRNSAASGYVVHLEEVCVKPELVALYRAQLDAEGWNGTGRLPALRNNQALGQALGAEIKVAIRDAGSFMDPRSQKDWWR